MLQIPSRIPILFTDDIIVMPGSSSVIKVDRSRDLNLVKYVIAHTTSLRSCIIGTIPRTLPMEKPKHPIGTAVIIMQISGMDEPPSKYMLLVHGLCRISVERITQNTPYVVAQVTQIGKWPFEPDDNIPNDGDLPLLSSKLRQSAIQLVNALDVNKEVLIHLKTLLKKLPDHALPDLLASMLHMRKDKKMEMLNCLDALERIQRIYPLIMERIENVKLVKIKKDLAGSFPNGNKIGKKDLQILNEEGLIKDDKLIMTPKRDHDSLADGLECLEKKLKSVGLPPNVSKVAMRELQRLKKMPSALPEHSVLLNYLELLTDLPWCISTTDTLDLQKAKEDLDKDHHSMEILKKRVLEYLAVQKLKHRGANIGGLILCFVGPPGVGKTSIGRSIAKTLGRKFHRISLGGVCDQSDIRGHRRTYIGSMPGRIISGLKSVGANNPVFLLDEVDKLGKGLQGDPGAALLEVLDAEQNHSFVDHYLNVPFDLSNILFIATANITSTIPSALLDRMEILEVPGYTEEEKITICKKHLWPKQLDVHGLHNINNGAKPDISEEAIKKVVKMYTREAGVRELDRKLASICRAVAVQATSNSQAPLVDIGVDDLPTILGPQKFDRTDLLILSKPGVAAGLAWTKTGGELMYVEASCMDRGQMDESSIGKIILTGQLGDVMKESAQLAVSWVRSNVKKTDLKGPKLSNSDIHLHFPAGAVGKDGPSAGITIATALVSLLSGKLVRSDIAMTGEITLQGRVLPVGGIKEKVLAAHRAGINKVLLPAQNRRDVITELPHDVCEAMDIQYVGSIEEVLENAFLDEVRIPIQCEALMNNSSKL
uniref:Lon protease homolog n=1 Tax=Phallusia mammillata TaxID=59560 RepID=A0A6F9DK01_9ASCI|nr:lon protease homolog 2, peroxisomal-like [Phallusia mammillata]